MGRLKGQPVGFVQDDDATLLEVDDVGGQVGHEVMVRLKLPSFFKHLLKGLLWIFVGTDTMAFLIRMIHSS